MSSLSQDRKALRVTEVVGSDEVTTSSASIPWLSQHHRMLIDHFIGHTVCLFAESDAEQQEINSAIIPMAVDTKHGFSLLAVILSLASTHRLNLGLQWDVAKIEYWNDMSVGHLRRPMCQEVESTETVFAATALMLCVRDIIRRREKLLVEIAPSGCFDRAYTQH